MAKIFGNVKTGQIATARDLKGLKNLKKFLGFVEIISNYKGFYYAIWRKWGEEKRQYIFNATRELNKEAEILMEEVGYEKVKDAKTNEIPEQFRFVNPEDEHADAYFPDEERKEQIFKNIHKENLEKYNPYECNNTANTNPYE